MTEQYKEFENQLRIWVNKQENIGDDQEAWGLRVFVHAAKQSELLASPIAAPEVHDIAWREAMWRWHTEQFRKE